MDQLMEDKLHLIILNYFQIHFYNDNTLIEFVNNVIKRTVKSLL